ncbi:hypothetical protein [Streptomyces sp900129855]|uniref:DNA primase/polymerase bifunctional N-terminal domain-containing protein n=1 Tax=Streptomyces sp. 900129855 TaxID=3155129 RepID=A0ABV2ZBG3_9ACTN
MTTDTRTRALHPAEPEPGILIHPRADRELATAHWLLSAHPAPSRAATEWVEYGIALLPLGTLMSAVRLPQDLVHAVADRCGRDDVDSFLDEALNGGPVICDPQGCRYYALVPAGMPASWHVAAVEWHALGVECLGRGTYPVSRSRGPTPSTPMCGTPTGPCPCPRRASCAAHLTSPGSSPPESGSRATSSEAKSSNYEGATP